MMRKFFTYLFLFVFILLPFKAFAAVDITLEDESTTTQKSVGILINSGTDEVEKIGFQIQASSNVTISSVEDQSEICSTFDYTNVSNLITVSCTFEEAKALDGYIAAILFESTAPDYTFTVSKTAGLDLGTLTLGTVTDITTGSTETTDNPEITAQNVGTTEDATTAESTQKGFQEMLTDYLPYILIGGATILLISILGILLSKKKDPKPEEIVTQVEEKKEEIAPAETRPTDIDNISGNLYTPQVKEETIQEKLEVKPIPEQATEVPSPASESNDLADLMAKDNSQAQAAPAPDFNAMPVETPTPAVEETTPIPNFNTMPVETPAPVIEETVPTPDFNTMPVETPPPVVEETAPVLPSNLPDMQQMVNNWAAAPKEETTPTDEPQSVPPVQPTI